MTVSLLILLIGIAAVFAISTHMVQPLDRMATTVERIAHGDLSVRAEARAARR